MWQNVHPVYGAGIRTHNLYISCLLPLPLDSGSNVVFLLLVLFSVIKFANVLRPGKIWKVSDNILRVYLVFGQNFEPITRKFLLGIWYIVVSSLA